MRVSTYVSKRMLNRTQKSCMAEEVQPHHALSVLGMFNDHDNLDKRSLLSPVDMGFI